MRKDLKTGGFEDSRSRDSEFRDLKVWTLQANYHKIGHSDNCSRTPSTTPLKISSKECTV